MSSLHPNYYWFSRSSKKFRTVTIRRFLNKQKLKQNHGPKSGIDSSRGAATTAESVASGLQVRKEQPHDEWHDSQLGNSSRDRAGGRLLRMETLEQPPGREAVRTG